MAVCGTLSNKNMKKIFALLVFALCFAGIYHRFITRKNLHAGVGFGALWGITGGVCMGLGSYVVMPIPASLGLVWFFTVLVEAIIAGAIVGAVYGSQYDMPGSQA